MARLTKVFTFLLRQMVFGLLLVGLTCTYPLFSQSTVKPPHPRAIGKYQVDQWGARDGIPSDEVSYILQAKDGYLWMLSTNKLCRYDGVKFETVDIKPGTVGTATTIYLDYEGILWVGTSEGKVLNYRDNRFKLVPPDTKQGNYPEINTIFKSRSGDLWIGSTFALIRYSNGIITRNKNFFSVRDIIEDSNSNIWISSINSDLRLFRNGKFESYPIPGDNNGTKPSKSTKAAVYRIMEDRRGILWAGTNQGVLAIENPLAAKGKKIHRFTTAQNLNDNTAGRLFEDHNGDIWVASENGVNRIRRTSAGEFHVESIMKDTIVNCVFEDREHGVWVGTRYDYLKRLRKGPFTSYHSYTGFSSFLPCIYKSKSDAIWMGTYKGKLVRFDNGRFDNPTVFLGSSNLLEKGFTTITEDNTGHLWLGTFQRGAFKFREKDGSLIHIDALPPDLFVINIMCDSKERTWVSSINGLYYQVNKGGPWKHLQKKDGLPDALVYSVFEDSENALWVCTDSGLLHFPDGDIDFKNSATYLDGFDLTSIYEDNDFPEVFWLTTYDNGLIRFSNGKWFQFNKKKGLPSDRIQNVLEDELGNFWLGCPLGVIKVNKKALNDFAVNQDRPFMYTIFNESSGIYRARIAPFAKNSAVRGPNGRFIFSTKYGIAAVQPTKVKINRLPPPVVIKEIRVNGNVVEHGDSPGPDRVMPSFYNAHTINFRFAALTFLSPEKVKFKTTLSGYDTDWKSHESLDQRNRTYRDLPFGEYTFQVIACNSNGVWNIIGASYRFQLKPYFYQTLLFKILLFLFIALLGVVLYRGIRKYRYLKKIENKYKTSTLQKEQAKEYLKQLQHLMQTKKPYRDETLSLQTLARQLSILPRVLSQLINEHLSMNFSDYISSYRIGEAREYLEDKTNNLSNIEICFKVGFNSQTSFYRAFRKETGMSPSQYRKKH